MRRAKDLSFVASKEQLHTVLWARHLKDKKKSEARIELYKDGFWVSLVVMGLIWLGWEILGGVE